MPESSWLSRVTFRLTTWMFDAFAKLPIGQFAREHRMAIDETERELAESRAQREYTAVQLQRVAMRVQERARERADRKR